MELETVIIPIEDLRIREMVHQIIEETANLLYAGSIPREDAIDIVSSRINMSEEIGDIAEMMVDSFAADNSVEMEIMGIDKENIEIAIPENDLYKLGGKEEFIRKFVDENDFKD